MDNWGRQLASLDDWAQGLIEQMAPPQRRRLLRKMAVELRKSNQKRIRNNVSPDGGRFERRSIKANFGQVTRGKMFRKMPRLMKTKSDADSFEVGFAGSTGRIATTHQFGRSAAPAPGSPAASYPIRALLGISRQDRAMLNSILVDHLDNG